MPNQYDERFTVEQVIEALNGAGGVVLGAAVKLGCNRHTVEHYCEKYPAIAEALREIKENRKDMAELKLLDAVDKGQAWAVRAYLEFQASERGWARAFKPPPPPDRPLAGRIDPATLSDADLDLLERLVERLASGGPAEPGGDQGGEGEAAGRRDPGAVH